MQGDKYKDFDYSMTVEVGAGGAWSESLSINLLDALKANGDIDTDDYIELYPESVMPFKKQLKQIREKHKLEEQMAAMNQQQSTNVPTSIPIEMLNQQ